ncbi:hypothetical protein [Brevundimonas sp. Root1279]|uniref:hypothetical protein n=1 Tax=Brevundimonas sp. Root1279 TaxID=1736443 RepID=UPI0006FE97BE|nr:hypothetical protein [Brevundimonas sp. Root1279]KQW83096.1 hypothetical protein ASC65_07115 [Brevundimonas sp. Root1279]
MHVALALALAVSLQQAPTGQILWQPQPDSPAPATAAEVAAPAPALPTIPDWARADPFGYERSECSPLVRKAEESLEVCQARVRSALAANLGSALPPGLAPVNAPNECRQAAAGDRYAVQCGAPLPAGAPSRTITEQTCENRPQAQPQGGVTWTQECRPADGSKPAEGGLRFRLGGDD